MEKMLVLFVHNRPVVLQRCFKTGLFNSGVDFDEITIYNDGSNEETNELVIRNVKRLRRMFPDTLINLFHFYKNLGYGTMTELSFLYIYQRNPKYLFRLEQDYIFRENWAKEVLSVLKSKQDCVGIAGYSHPDFYNPKRNRGEYIDKAKLFLGHDVGNREYYYKPFFLDTPLRKIKLQGTSNSCGTFYINWENFLKTINSTVGFGNFLQNLSKNNLFDDAYFSVVLSDLWYELYKDKIDLTENFALLDICDYGIADHICGNGINTKGIPENTTIPQVGSPIWKGLEY